MAGSMGHLGPHDARKNNFRLQDPYTNLPLTSHWSCYSLSICTLARLLRMTWVRSLVCEYPLWKCILFVCSTLMMQRWWNPKSNDCVAISMFCSPFSLLKTTICCEKSNGLLYLISSHVGIVTYYHSLPFSRAQTIQTDCCVLIALNEAMYTGVSQRLV